LGPRRARQLQKRFNRQFLRARWIPDHLGDHSGDPGVLCGENGLQIEPVAGIHANDGIL
jgi:hypothetical protein